MNWWNHWASLQKGLGKEIIDHKIHIKDLIKDKDLHKEVIKEHTEFKEFKEHPEKIIKEKDKEKDILEGGGIFNPGDPAAPIQNLAQRVARLEIAAGQAFIRPEERPDVGGRVAAEKQKPK
jgi:hypothetical protein